MTAERNDETTESKVLRDDGVYPSNVELGQRLARVEAKQDAQLEKLDYISEQLDGRLSAVSGKVDTMLPRHNRMWFVYRGSKWLLGALIAGGATIEITGWL
jgi:hypothetical protein